ncbi:MAG: cytidylate kinase-like family protein [Bacteroidetes bacterium]|nr:cytidylate kinase-like family protein [Bacteroidales bacterium]NJO69288.1 cytidylate kinase-like family protein [Bacteroidota bacterium]
MSINLISYLKDRYQEIDLKSTDPGPVITIAREMGCPGKCVAKLLTEALNTRKSESVKHHEWKWVGKEIFAEAAKELNLEPETIKQVFEDKRGILDEILSSQSSKYYKSDQKILNTTGKIIRSIANHGNVVVVGRGGIAFTKDINKSLHIFLEAPLEWRALRLCEKYHLSILEAKKYAIEIDQKREKYREFFKGKNNDYTWFDIRFNCMTTKPEEMVSLIIKMAELKK